MVKEKLLVVRKQLKSKKPTFKRSQVNQFAKLKNTGAWRKPKGMGNKIRRARRGQPKMPSVGYGSPAKVRGLGFLGLREKIISNIFDLSNVNEKEEIVVLSRTLGGKKKLAILNEIKSKKILVANVKDIEKEIKALTKVRKTSSKKKEVKSEENKKEAKKE